MAVMTVQKLSIALDEDVAREAKDAAECAGLSLSAWLNEAAREALAIKEGLAAVAEYEAEYGAFTEEELARADAALARLGIHSRR